MRNTFLNIIFCIFIPTICFSQTHEALSNSELYSRLKFHEGLWRLENPTRDKLKEKCGPGSHGFYCETKDSKAYFELRAEMQRRSTILKDPIAQSFFALALMDEGNRLGSDERHAEALSHFRSSCSMDVASSCFNAGLMLIDGKGSPRSPSAAIEWFYKAGIGFLKSGDRDKANAALDQIRLADSSSDLAQKLRNALREPLQK